MVLGALLGALCVRSQPAAAEPVPVTVRSLLTFEYRDGAATPEINKFLYLNTGFRADHNYFSLEIDTMLLIVIGDVIATLVKYMAGGGDDIPLMGALNGDTEPGYYRFFHMAARYNVLRTPKSWVGVGLSTQLSHVDTTFRGERVPVSPYDLGLTLEARQQVSPKNTLAVSFGAGNGWMRYSSFNPYYSIATWVNYKVGKFVGLFARGEWKRQRLDLTGYDNPHPPVDPSIIRIREWIDLWAIDAGLSLSF